MKEVFCCRDAEDEPVISASWKRVCAFTCASGIFENLAMKLATGLIMACSSSVLGALP